MSSHSSITSSVANTLSALQREFPNLEWRGYKKNSDRAHGFKAIFHNCWSLTVEVTPLGCRATLSTGNGIIADSPNEQDHSLEFVVSHIREEWDAIAHSLSRNSVVKN